MKRVLALLLTVTMLLSLAPAALAADDGQTEPGTVAAEEIPGMSRLDELNVSGRQSDAQPLYSDDDIVTVIVQLEGPSLLDYYHPAAVASDGLTAGEAVSMFLSGSDASAAEEDMLAQQDELLSAISALQGRAFRSGRNADIELIAQWTVLINGMAVRMPYGYLSDIQALDGVKRAYVEHTYEAPEPMEFTGAGNAGYSYDMVGLDTAWGAGYTGKGMLVAVVDTGLDLEWASFSTDSGNVTDIRRTHEAFREGSFKTKLSDEDLRYTQASIEAFLKSHTLKAHSLASPSAVNTAAYKNKKVPYAFDYAGDADPYTGEIISGDVNVFPGQDGNAHGTHVAGTVAGYVKTEEGEVKFSGVAPDAQLIIMKVFDDSGTSATTSSIMNALEDTLVLGADVVNLSLGADNGFAQDDTVQPEVYQKLENAGIILMTSAGNSAYSSSSNERGDYNLSSDPEISMMSSPAVYSTNISVASINNTVTSQMTLVWNDGIENHKAAFTDYFEVAMKSTFSEEKMPEGGIEIIPVGGTGTWQDYYDAGFRTSAYDNGKTGIALVQRGDLSFVDKIKNAQSFVWQDYQQGQTVYGGIKGVIVYDNVEGELFNMSVEDTSLTSAAISKADGEAIVAAFNAGKKPTLVRVNQEDEIISASSGYEMSSFTSWGAGPGLELKPEITAPGGNIFSAIIDTTYNEGAGYYDDYDGTYAMMSGTSMAAPHMSGLAALVRQYVQKEGLASGAAAGDLTNQLLASTAVPQKQKDSTAYYSPRQQGAGLVNVGAAITTPAYITVEDQLVGKLELKDDPNWTGTYPVEFQVTNLTGSPVTYTVQAAVQRPDTSEETGHTFMLDSDVLVKTVNLGTVTVPANGSATVRGTIQLTASEISQLRGLFRNGTYIEGFITLTSSDKDVPQIGLPYLAFLGDWTAAPIFDSTLWIDGRNPWEDGDYTWWPTVVGSAVIGETGVLSWLNLGQNIFDPTSDKTQTEYKLGNLTISPNGDGLFDVVDDFELYQLRDAKMIVVEVKDAKTGEVYYRDFSSYNTKTLFETRYNTAIPSSISFFTGSDWDGTDLDGNLLPSGTKCVYTITAYGEGEYEKTNYGGIDYPVTDFWSVDPSDPSSEPTFNGHAMDKTGDVITFPIVVDYVAPKLVNNAVSIYEEDGRIYLEGTVYDEDGSLASVEIVPIVNRIAKPEYTHGTVVPTETGPDYINPFYDKLIWDEGAKTWSFRVDVTEYAHTNKSYDEYGYTRDDQYDWEWTGNVYIFCGDYGANDRSYAIKVADMAQPGEILLSQSSALLHPGSTFELSVVDNSGSDAAIVRTSSNPDVATIDEFGNVVAIAPGQTTITVSNGRSSATCIVAVEEYPTEVIDFDLSIDYFEGLKPGVPITVNVVNLQPADVVFDEITWLVYEDDEDWAGLVDVYQNTQTGLSGQIETTVNVSEDPIPGGSGRLEVTINGVTRSMRFTWDDIPTTSTKDYLISASNYNEQTICVTSGETATLVAQYKQSKLHSVIPVELFGSEKRDEQGAVTEKYPASVGLELDGEPYGTSDGSWTGKLVAEPGYTLPERITIGYRYPSEYYEGGYYEYTYWDGSYESYSYSYNKDTGEIYVGYMPTGSSNSLVIRADGVETEGAPGGTCSGNDYTMPDGLYGPFDWSFTNGLNGVSGELTPFEDELLLDGYSKGNGAYFTPSEPGVSYITATSKDGQYSINFAVVCEPVLATKLDLSVHDLDLAVGESRQILPTLTPEPTLDKNAEILWTSFNPEIAQVDADGQVTAIRDGYAYIKAAVKTDTTVQSYCVVKVGTGIEDRNYSISYVLDGGSWLSSSSAPTTYTSSTWAQTLNVSSPFKAGYTFKGWTYEGQSTPVQSVVLPAGFSGDLVLYANWEVEYVPAPVVPKPAPSGSGSTGGSGNSGGSDNSSTSEPSQPEEPSIKVSTSDTSDDGAVVTETTAIPDAVVEGDTAVSTVTEEMGAEIVSQAVNRGSDMVIIAPEVPADVVRTEVSIPAGTLGEIAEKTEAGLQIKTPAASVTIPNEGLSGLAAAGGEVTVSTSRNGNLVEVDITANGTQVSQVDGGVTVNIPQPGCTASTVAMLIQEDGSMTVVRQSIASSDGQSIVVPLDGSAMVVIMEKETSFNDVSATSWMADAVAFASSHELMNGTGDGIFEPNASMTRGMLAMVLHNLENNPGVGVNASFGDVKDGAWYAEAVAWAAAKGVVTGYADGSFGPNDPITREQLAVMLYRYAGSPAVSAAALNFVDADEVGSYAEEAIAWAVANGIMNGKTGGVLDPKGNATRAEVAQMLLNFLSSMI